MNIIWPARNEIVWLVKSGDRILGPYSADVVEKLLKAREIVVIDEIKRSYSRWKYIREEAFFAVVVEKMRAASQSRMDDTQRGTLSNPTATMTATADLSRTLDIDLPDGAENQSAYIQDAEFIDIEIVDNDAATSAGVETKQFGVTPSVQLQKNIQKSSLTAWFFALIFVGIFLTVAYKIMTKPAASNQEPDFAKIFDTAIKNYRLGYFVDALKFYKEASLIRPNDPDVIIGMSPLLLNIEGQKVEVKRKIGEVLAIVHSEDQVKQAKNILGLVAIADEDFSEALRQFTDSLKIDATYIPATFNSGVVHFLQKDFQSADNDFGKVLALDSGNSSAAYLRILSSVVHSSAAKSLYPEVHEKIRNFRDSNYNLRQEANLLDAYLYSKEDVSQNLKDRIRTTLESDPFLTDEFMRDPLLSVGQLSWIHLASYCEEMMKNLSNSSDMKALYSICLLKTGRAQEAPKLIEEALAQSPSDSLLLSVKAYILMTSGRVDEAHAALELAKGLRPNILANILAGRICMKSKDDRCITENFQNLNVQDMRDVSPVAIVGLAEVARRNKSLTSVNAYHDRIKPYLKNYLPSIRLESELGTN